MRLDKYLSHAGVGTRKEVKQLIRKKHVRVNGELVVKDDMHVEEDDLVQLDGELAHHLLSPKHHVRKTYYVEHQLCLDETAIKTLCNGSIILDEKTVLCAALEVINETSCFFHIEEGRYHQIKRMFSAVGNEVLYLKRVAMGPLRLDDHLEVGEWRALTQEELAALKAVA